MSLLKFKNTVIGFSRKAVLEDIDGALDAGSFALEGVNGSGKTTTINTVAGILKPLAGSIEINGFNLNSDTMNAKLAMSYMPDEASVYPFMTGKDLLSMIGYFKSCEIDSETVDMIEALNITQYLEARFDMMSLGTQRKFSFVGALLGKPKVLLLDEPMNGLDKASVDLMSEYLRAIATKSVVIFTSHQDKLKDDLGARVLQISDKMLLGL